MAQQIIKTGPSILDRIANLFGIDRSEFVAKPAPVKKPALEVRNSDKQFATETENTSGAKLAPVAMPKARKIAATKMDKYELYLNNHANTIAWLENEYEQHTGSTFVFISTVNQIANAIDAVKTMTVDEFAAFYKKMEKQELTNGCILDYTV